MADKPKSKPRAKPKEKPDAPVETPRRPIGSELLEAHAAFGPLLDRLRASGHPAAVNAATQIQGALGAVAGHIKAFVAVLNTRSPGARPRDPAPPTVGELLAEA